MQLFGWKSEYIGFEHLEINFLLVFSVRVRFAYKRQGFLLNILY